MTPTPLSAAVAFDSLSAYAAATGGFLASATAESALPLAALIAQGESPSPFGGLFFPMMVIMLLAYFIMIRPQQQKQRRYDEMIASLKQNDRIVTTGGLHGVVSSVQRDAETVTVRLDDATGAKVKVSMWAISHMAAEDKPAADKADAAKTDAKATGGKNQTAAKAGKK
ncbi:MAG: preprotein translocase subunit YajC [Planctomycetota bacterium]